MAAPAVRGSGAADPAVEPEEGDPAGEQEEAADNAEPIAADERAASPVQQAQGGVEDPLRLLFSIVNGEHEPSAIRRSAAHCPVRRTISDVLSAA